jgi:hypothetical protein
MAAVPRSPCDDSSRQNGRCSDGGKPSKAAVPILTIPHAALLVLAILTSGCLASGCLGEQCQDAIDDVDSNDL